MTRIEPPQPAGRLASGTAPPTPLVWPKGKTAAACLTFDMDAEAVVLTADISSIRRMTPMSHQSYGPLVPDGYRAPMWELNYHTPGLLRSADPGRVEGCR